MSPWNLIPSHLSPGDAHPGISASEEDWFDLIDALRETLDTFAESHPDFTYGDGIHATKYLADALIREWAENTADA
jgi:hypothetical protein